MTLRLLAGAVIVGVVVVVLAAVLVGSLPWRSSSKAHCRPDQLELGMSSAPGAAGEMRAIADFGFRYQYLAGGLDEGWQEWEPRGRFIADYVHESVEAGACPVFSYYMLQQSGRGQSEQQRLEAAFADPLLMRRYFEDLRELFRQLERAGESSIVHFEPDLSGFMQQSEAGANTTVVVAGSGLRELSELPNSVSGLAQALVLLRDIYAPKVLLGYHVSLWGNGTDLVYDTRAEAAAAAGRDAANFYTALGARFDLAFTEFSDRDSGFKEIKYGDAGASWWTADTFARHLTFLETFNEATGLDVYLWQIPFGNTVMRAVNNTWNHYQDNKVETLLDDPEQKMLRRYRDAGVVAFLFGRGADGATDASDANHDGVTNPVPINGNDRESLNADDDGGYFHELAARFYSMERLENE